jgi:LemA protein
MTPPAIALIVLAAVTGWGLYTYNVLVHARAKVREGLSGVDVQLKLRHDLAPNLVETVRGYAAHEQETLRMIAAHRSEAIAATQPGDVEKAENGLAQELSRALLLAEVNPGLKASADFARLVDELSEIEDEVQASRALYNSNVEYYNSRAQAFPTFLVANWMHPSSFDYLNLQAVDFGTDDALVGEFAA